MGVLTKVQSALTIQRVLKITVMCAWSYEQTCNKSITSQFQVLCPQLQVRLK